MLLAGPLTLKVTLPRVKQTGRTVLLSSSNSVYSVEIPYRCLVKASPRISKSSLSTFNAVSNLRTRVLTLPASRPVKTSPALWHLIQGIRLRLVGDPKILEPEETSSKMPKPKPAFYAVAAGRKPGIYLTWAEAEAQVKGFPAAKYKKFNTKVEAQSFIDSSNGSGVTSNTTDSNIVTNTSSLSLKRKREASPPTQASSSTLPPDLKAIADKGYSFTESTPHHLIVYTDGSSLNNGRSDARAGLGVWWGSQGDAAEMGLSERLPGALQTNNRGELLSVIRALETCPFPDLPIEIRTDSQYTIACMTLYLPKWLKDGWLTSTRGNQSKVKNVDLIKHLLVLLRRRGPKNGVKFKYIPGHQGFEGNEGADRLARKGSSMEKVPDRTDWLDPDNEEDLREVKTLPRAEVDVEIDENWLLSEEELAALEEEFK